MNSFEPSSTSSSSGGSAGGSVAWTLVRRSPHEPACCLPGLDVFVFQRGSDAPINCVAATDLEHLYTKYAGLKKRIQAGMKTEERDKLYFKLKPGDNRAAFRQCFSNNATNGKCLVPCEIVQTAVAEMNLEREARRESIAAFVERLTRSEREWVLGEIAGSLRISLPFTPSPTPIDAELSHQALPARQTRQRAAQADSADSDAPCAEKAPEKAPEKALASAEVDDADLLLEQMPASLGLFDDELSPSFSGSDETLDAADSDELDHHKRKRGSVGGLFEAAAFPFFGFEFHSSAAAAFEARRRPPLDVKKARCAPATAHKPPSAAPAPPAELFAPAGSMVFGAAAKRAWGAPSVDPRDLHAPTPLSLVKRSSAASSDAPRHSSFVSHYADTFVDSPMDDSHRVLGQGGVGAAAAAAAAVLIKPDVKRVVRTGLRRGRG